MKPLGARYWEAYDAYGSNKMLSIDGYWRDLEDVLLPGDYLPGHCDPLEKWKYRRMEGPTLHTP